MTDEPGPIDFTIEVERFADEGRLRYRMRSEGSVRTPSRRLRTLAGIECMKRTDEVSCTKCGADLIKALFAIRAEEIEHIAAFCSNEHILVLNDRVQEAIARLGIA